MQTRVTSPEIKRCGICLVRLGLGTFKSARMVRMNPNTLGSVVHKLGIPGIATIGDNARRTVSIETERETIEMHQRGIGVKTIGKLQNRAPWVVRDTLIKLGVYHPDPKHNGTAKKGAGQHSRILASKNRSKYRSMAAKCLHALRSGVPIESTMKADGMPHSSVWNVLRKTKAYKRITLKLNKRFAGQHKGLKSKQWSKVFRTELDYQNTIEQMLKKAGIEYEREKTFEALDYSADFWLSSLDIAIETKTSMRSGEIQRALGQAIIYKAMGARQIWLMYPMDVEMAPEAATILSQHMRLVQTNGEMPQNGAGIPPVNSILTSEATQVGHHVGSPGTELEFAL